MTTVFIAAGHAGTVSSLAYSPDGGVLASSGEDATVRLWDARSLVLRRVLTGPTDGWVSEIAWSPDGAQIAGANRPLYVWTVRTGAVALRLDQPRDGTLAVAWSPAGSSVAFGGYDLAVTWCEPATAAVQRRERTPDAASVTALAWSPDGTRLAVGTWNGGIHLWSVRAVRFVAALVGPDRIRRERRGPTPLGDYLGEGDDADTRTAHDGGVRGLAWSPDGERLVSAGADGAVRLWASRTFAYEADLIHRRDDDADATAQIAWSPDGAAIATALRGEIVVWSADQRHPIQRHAIGRELEPTAIAWHPAGDAIAAAAADGRIHVLRASQPGSPARIVEASPAVHDAGWSPDRGALAIGAGRAVQLWDVPAGRIRAIGETRRDVRHVAWSPRSDAVAGVADHDVHVWDAATGAPRWRVTCEAWKFALAWSHGGDAVAAGGLQRDVDVWDARTGALRAHLDWEGSELIAWSPDDERLAVGGSAGRSVALWTPRTGDIQVLEGHRTSIWTAAWSPDGATVATTEALDPSVRLWDAATGTLRSRLAHGPRACWSPNGAMLATFEVRGALRIWDMRGETLLADLCSDREHRHADVAWSPDGRYLASGGGTEVRVWEAATGRELAPLGGHLTDIARLAWAPDGKTILVVTTHDAELALHRIADGAAIRVRSIGRSVLAYTRGGVHGGDPDTYDHVRAWVGDDSASARAAHPHLLHPTLIPDFFAGRPIPP